MDTLVKLNNHPAIEEIYAAIQREHPAVSRTTVYRNLRHLATNGIIRQVMVPDGLERYDGRNVQHYHLKCKTCGIIFDIDIEYPEGIDEMVQRKYGFQIEEHDVVFKGICTKCKGE